MLKNAIFARSSTGFYTDTGIVKSATAYCEGPHHFIMAIGFLFFYDEFHTMMST